MRYNNLTLGLIATVVVLLAVIGYLYWGKKEGLEKVNMDGVVVAPRARAPSPVPSPETKLPEGQGPCIVLFHATWCSHCKDVLPIWQNLKAGAKGNIQILDIESKNPAISQHQIQGFPTIRFFPQGLAAPDNYKDYQGPRTLDGIVQFLSSL